MNKRIFLGAYIVVLTMLLSSCFNLFSIFNPGEPGGVTDVKTLISMGDQKLKDLEYSNAYANYARAVELDPDNSVAIEGMCTAYLFWKVPVTNVLQAVVSSDFALLEFNTLYDISDFLGNNLYTIVNKKGDGVIPYNDVNLNLNFFLFNTLYSIFYLADTDGDGDINADTNDFLIIYPDLTFTNNFPSMTNFVEAIAMAKIINDKYDFFMDRIARSEYAIELISNQVVSTDAQALVQMVSMPIVTIKTSIQAKLSNITSGVNVLDQFGITNIDDITNIIADSGFDVTNYDEFTNSLGEAGITNVEDLTGELTNIFPEMTNIDDLISNYFGL